MGIRQGGNACLQGFDETLFRTEQTTRHDRTAGSQKRTCIALRRAVPQTCQKHRLGLAATCFYRLPGIPFQSERRLMGRRRRADGNHAEHGKGFRGNASRTEKSGHGNPCGCGLPAPFPSGIWKNNGPGRKDQVHLSGLQCRDRAYLRCPTAGREIRQRPIRLG